jgi:hypothetical protein
MMNTLATFTLVLLCLFWLLFLGRAAMLMSQGIKVFTLVRGKKLIPRLLEGILIPALVFWTAQAAATVSFGTAWRVGIDEQNSRRLVTTGAKSADIYRHCSLGSL